MTGAIFLPALQGQFGDWVYYTTIIPLCEVKERIDFARELHKNQAAQRTNTATATRIRFRQEESCERYRSLPASKRQQIF